MFAFGRSNVGVMSDTILPSSVQWGYRSPSVSPSELITALVQATQEALRTYAALPDGPEPSHSAPGYSRASVEIPLSPTLADQLMNGSTGYRAHFAASVTLGEAFNLALVQAVAPLVIAAEALYASRFTRGFCSRSLLGRFSKFWYPRELTDPSAQAQLLNYKPAIRHTRWVRYWQTLPQPHKGLLAPVSSRASVLLNGTFVSEDGTDFEQKPDRSRQLLESGWT